jgi:hypothetical protein
MKNTFIAGIVMVVLGAALLGYGYFNYTTTEQVLKIGPIVATAEKEHTVSFPPILGWLLVGGGICVLIFGAGSRKN